MEGCYAAEMSIIKNNKSWKPISKLEGKNAFKVKWIFRTKYIIDGSVNKHNARLAVKGYG